MKYTVLVTRDVTFTQSGTVEVDADSPDAAHAQALDLAEASGQSGVDWQDDDGSFHFGEDGAYVADPDSITPEAP